MDACERCSSRAEDSLAKPPFRTRIHSLKLSVMGISSITRPLEKWKKPAVYTANNHSLIKGEPVAQTMIHTHIFRPNRVLSGKP
jgi:hypothetical protein